MGASKVELFLHHIVAAARPVFDEVVAVDRAGGSQIPGIRTIFEEPHEGEAAVFGVVRALQDARGRAFLLAVDYPLVTGDVLRYLRDGLKTIPPQLDPARFLNTPETLGRRKVTPHRF